MTFFVPVLAIVIAVCILVHHRYKHANDPMSDVDKWFQVSDVSNHETWIVALCFFACGFLMANVVI